MVGIDRIIGNGTTVVWIGRWIRMMSTVLIRAIGSILLGQQYISATLYQYGRPMIRRLGGTTATTTAVLLLLYHNSPAILYRFQMFGGMVGQ